MENRKACTLDGLPRDAHVEDIIGYYAEGGYHPVHIGDRIGIGERFEVQHKLGYNETGTIWLCLDSKNGRRVGVKILKASKSLESHPEVLALRLFDGIDREELYANHVFPVEEYFWIEGPNGRHLCFIIQVLGPAISYTLEGIDLDTPDTLADLCLQAANGLKYLHDRKICHGNFSPDHMRLQLDWRSLSDKKIYDLLGAPKVWHLGNGNNDGQPRYLVESADINKLEEEYRTGKIAIDSFAASYRIGDTIEPQIHDVNYTPPEVRFLKESSGFKGDIWSLASTIHLLRTGKLLLARLDSNSSNVSWLAWAYGPFPNQTWKPIGEYLSNDSAVPVFTANTIFQKPPSPPRGRTARRQADWDRINTQGYPVEWGEHRDEVIALLLGEEDTPRTIQQRRDLQGVKDRKKYIRVKLPRNGTVWSKFQEQRGRLTGFKSLLHEDLSKERQWYELTDPNDGETFYVREAGPVSLDDATLEKLNSTWDLALSAAEESSAKQDTNANTSDGINADEPANNHGKRVLREEDQNQESQPKAKKAKTFVAQRNLRDCVECVEQDDGMTKYSYRLQPEEVDLLGTLLGKMLRNNPEDRISIDEVLEHKWFDGSRKRLEAP